MQWAARQAMHFTTRLADGFVAERDEFLVERARCDLPETFPIHFHVAFLGEFLAGVLCLLKHFCEHGGIEMALVERDATFFNNTGAMPGLGRAGADGANAVAACARQSCKSRNSSSRRRGRRLCGGFIGVLPECAA